MGKRLRMRWAVGLAGLLAVMAGSVANAATQAENDAKRNAIEQGLRSGNKDQIDSAFAQLTLWSQQDSGNAENGLWRLRALILPMSDHAFQTLGVIESAKAFKNAKNPYGIGYLYVMEAVCLFQLDKADDATAILREGAQRDPTHITDDLAADLTKALIAHNRPDDYADTLRKIVIGCADQPPIVEFALRQRIAFLNGQDKAADALADAKSLFNVTTMEHTADAISLLDRQLLLPNMNDRTKVSEFRSQQLAGARPPSANAPPTTSSVVLGIKVDGALYEDALKGLADDSYAESMRHTALLLVAAKPEDALAVAKRALGQATDPKEIRAASACDDSTQEELGEDPVTVVIPYAIGTPHLREDESRPESVSGKNMHLDATTTPAYWDPLDAGQVMLATVYLRFITVTVNDQFGVLLSSLYNGASITENGTAIAPTMLNGSYSDPVGAWTFSPYGAVPAGGEKVTQWEEAKDPGYTPLDDLSGGEIQNYTITVDGRTLDTLIHRSISHSTGNPSTIGVDWP